VYHQITFSLAIVELQMPSEDDDSGNITLFPIITMEDRELTNDVSKGPFGKSIGFGVVCPGDVLNFYISEGVEKLSGLLFPTFNVNRS
jgi:hypothetical protein